MSVALSNVVPLVPAAPAESPVMPAEQPVIGVAVP